MFKRKIRKTWIEVNRQFTPGFSGQNFKAKGMTQDELDKYAFGFTTIEMRCIETGELKFYEQIGDQR